MASSDFSENYGLAGPVLRKLYDSGLRMAILDALKEGPLRLADLRREVDANAPNTSSKAKDLEDMGLVERAGGKYLLTDWGGIILKNVSKSLQLVAAKEKLSEYWDTHHIKGIPKDMQEGLKAYSTAKIIKPTDKDIDYVDHRYMDLVRKRTKTFFYGMTPVFRPEYMEMLVELLARGVKMTLILDKRIIPSVLSLIPEDKRGEFVKAKNLEIYEVENLELAVSVSNDYCTCGFQAKCGPSTYMDMSPESFDPELIEFEKRLFERYLKKAKPVNFSDYL